MYILSIGIECHSTSDTLYRWRGLLMMDLTCILLFGNEAQVSQHNQLCSILNQPQVTDCCLSALGEDKAAIAVG